DFDDDPEDSAGCVIELFSGVLDGGNHAISGLNKALICRLDSEHNRTTIVKDLTLTDVSILNPDLYWNGAVVADNGGTIQNVHVTGTVSGSLFVGGLVGSNYGTIEQSSFTGTIQASLGSIAGGLVAVNHGTIRESFSAGSITGVMVVGGLVGTIDGGTISNCYTHMNVVGANHVGGIAGTILDRIDSVIQSVAVYGDITGDAVGVISSTSYVSDVPILFAGHVDSAAYVAEAYVMYTEGQTFVVPPENTIDIAALDDAYYLFVLEFNPSVWIINMGEARFLPTLRDNPE
ncbi:MAG: GLUG motif-containing protein, partial [Bacillota bacterium]|nr:GLUG motif-containing protein [Bacillota bacterium]